MRSNRSPQRPPPLPHGTASATSDARLVARQANDAAEGQEARHTSRHSSTISPLIRPVAVAVIITAIVVSAGYAALVAFDLPPERLIATLVGSSRVVSPTPAAAAADGAVAPAVPPASRQPAARPVGQSVPASVPRDRFTHAFSLWRDITYSLTAADPDQPQPFQQIRQMSGDLQYLDGGAFHTEDTLVRLSGIASLPREAVCIAENKTKFACGLQARASLSLLVSPERPRCYPDVSLATSEPAWLCTARGKLLSASQIEAGFALPSQPSIERYVMLAQQARDAHAGAWNGDWTLVPTGTAQP